MGRVDGEKQHEDDDCFHVARNCISKIAEETVHVCE